MKIKRNNRDVLVAEEVPWLMAIALTFFIFCFVAPGVAITAQGEWAGLIFALGGGGLGFLGMCVFVERLQLILDARDGTITLRRRTILKYDQVQHPLEKLLRAEVETTTSRKDGRTRTLYRPSLVLKDGDDEVFHPVTQVFSSGRRADRVVDAVNEWIAQRAAL